MLVHLVARPLSSTDHIPVSALALLARSLKSAGASVIEDLSDRTLERPRRVGR